MPDEDEREGRERRLTSRSIQLGAEQWRWLDERADRKFSRSAAAELRMLVAAAMQEEAARLGVAAA